jgi:hypothetical protein
MQYLVEAARGPLPPSPEQAIALLEGTVIPHFEYMIRLKAEGKMLAGGLPVGDRAFTCIIEAASNDEVSLRGHCNAGDNFVAWQGRSFDEDRGGLLTEHGSKLPAGGGRLLRKSLQPEGNKWLATVRQNTFTIFEPTGTSVSLAQSATARFSPTATKCESSTGDCAAIKTQFAQSSPTIQGSISLRRGKRRPAAISVQWRNMRSTRRRSSCPVRAALGCGRSNMPPDATQRS